MPIVYPFLRAASAFAAELGLYPKFSANSLTRFAVSAFTLPLLLRTLSTVPLETPLTSAIFFIVIDIKISPFLL